MRFILILCCVFILAACDREDVVYEHQTYLPDALWHYDDSVRFDFQMADTSSRYRLLLDIVHRDDYAWENFYMSITTRFPADSLQTDVVSFELANKAGIWYGSCRSGKCHLNIPLQERVRFPSPGDYALTFEQHMRVNPVEGVEGIGLKLVRLED